MKVFFRPEQVAYTNSYSKSSRKPALVVQDWLASSDINAEIESFEPLTCDDITIAHDADYVEGVLNGDIPNGFGNVDAAVARSLPYTTGSLLAAAEYAVLHRTVTCSPTSGFHHAGFNHGGGFCTFNGLAIAALSLQRTQIALRIGILDCDAHYGNGTDDILQRLNFKNVVHRTQGAHFHNRPAKGIEAYWVWLDKAINAMRACDVVLYQAGADPHVRDPLGGLLTTEEMLERDRRVFNGLGHLPLVWNLAGGYQERTGDTDAQRLEPVLALHRQTARLHTSLWG